MCQWFSNLENSELTPPNTHTHTHARSKKEKRICQISNDKRKSQPRFGLDWTRGGKSWRFNFASAARWVWVVRIPCRKMRSKRWGLGEHHHGWTWRDVTHAAGGETSVWRSDTGCGAGSTRSVDQELQQATSQDIFLLYELALNAPRQHC